MDLTMNKLIGKRFIKAMVDAGIVRAEDNATRVVIDARADGVVTLYVERFGDERLLGVVTTLEGIAISEIPKPPRVGRKW